MSPGLSRKPPSGPCDVQHAPELPQKSASQCVEGSGFLGAQLNTKSERQRERERESERERERKRENERDRWEWVLSL